MEEEEQNEEHIKFLRRPAGSKNHPLALSRIHRHRSNSNSQIISNPKLVQSLQNLDSCPRHNLIRPASCMDIRTPDYPGKRFQEEFATQQKKRLGVVGEWCHKYLGILLALFASFVFSLSSILVKFVINEYKAITLSLWTFQGIFLPSLVVLFFQGVVGGGAVCHRIWPLTSKCNLWNLCLVVGRALFGAAGTVLKVWSLQYMTAADSTVITFSSPVLVLVVAWICLKEPCGVVPIFTAFAVLLGVGVITRPPWITGEKEFDRELLVGCALAFGCTTCGVFAVVILRYVRNVPSSFITFIYGLLGTLFCLGAGWWKYDELVELPRSPEHWVYAIGIAFLSFLAQTTLTLAFQYEEAGPVSLIRPSEILFIFGWQFIFLGKIPDPLSVLGAFIVFSGVLVITARKWITTLPENHHYRKGCRWLLF